MKFQGSLKEISSLGLVWVELKILMFGIANPEQRRVYGKKKTGQIKPPGFLSFKHSCLLVFLCVDQVGSFAVGNDDFGIW